MIRVIKHGEENFFSHQLEEWILKHAGMKIEDVKCPECSALRVVDNQIGLYGTRKISDFVYTCGYLCKRCGCQFVVETEPGYF